MLDDSDGRWVRWSRSITLDSVLRRARLIHPAAGAEEGVAAVVLAPSAVEAVPGLAQTAEILRKAGLEQKIILLPDRALPAEEYRSRLLDAAAQAYGARRLVGYSLPGDPVMAGFEELLRPGKVSIARREPLELKLFVLQILDDVGISAAGSEEAATEILAATGLEQAA